MVVIMCDISKKTMKRRDWKLEAYLGPLGAFTLSAHRIFERKLWLPRVEIRKAPISPYDGVLGIVL
ncbi:hypothetical protein OAN61_00845 [bacterium]|nr:hypothetical protein [bacterium]